MVAQLFKDPACPLVLAVVEDGEAFEKAAVIRKSVAFPASVARSTRSRNEARSITLGDAPESRHRRFQWSSSGMELVRS